MHAAAYCAIVCDSEPVCFCPFIVILSCELQTLHNILAKLILIWRSTYVGTTLAEPSSQWFNMIGRWSLTLHTPYSTQMSPDNTHNNLFGGLILGIYTLYMLFCFFNPIHPIRNSLKKHKSMYIILTPSIKPSIKNPISLWVFSGLIRAL